MIYKPTIQNLGLARGKWRQVSAHTKVPYDTIKSIYEVKIKNPGVLTIERLHRYFETQQGKATLRQAETLRR